MIHFLPNFLNRIISFYTKYSQMTLFELVWAKYFANYFAQDPTKLCWLTLKSLLIRFLTRPGLFIRRLSEKAGACKFSPTTQQPSSISAKNILKQIFCKIENTANLSAPFYSIFYPASDVNQNQTNYCSTFRPLFQGSYKMKGGQIEPLDEQTLNG